MEKEKLIIKNFGPIKSVELDLGRFNILIGEQATGKSTVAKVLAVCRYFSYIYDDYTFREITEQHLSPFAEGLDAWGFSEYRKYNSYIYYECQHYTLTVEQSHYVITNKDRVPPLEEEDGFKYNVHPFYPILIPVSEQFKSLISELDLIKPKEKLLPAYESALGWVIPTSFFLNDVKNVMDNPFYIPTERGLQSIFSIGKNSINNLSDSLFNNLAKMDNIARQFKKETFIEPLNIYYVNRDGHGFIRKASEDTYYSLYNAASGYQAIIPIVLVVKYYTELKKKTKTLIIEEPELDVFPTAQNKLIQYLSEKAKTYDSMVLLTTHSPYTLTSVNNLMYAHKVGQIQPEKVSEEIDEKYWLDPAEVSCYRMMADGTARNIIDQELMQIDTGEIDEVSREINAKWDRLSDIEYSKTNEN